MKYPGKLFYYFLAKYLREREERIIFDLSLTTKDNTMTLLEIASKNGMTVTELKNEIIKKVRFAQLIGFGRKEAEEMVLEAFKNTIV